MEEYSTLRGVDSRLTNYVVGKSIIPGLGLKHKGGRCELKRNLGFSCFMEKLKGIGKARNLGHPIGQPP